MNRAQALRRAVKLFGKDATVRDYGAIRQSSHEARDIAKAELTKLREQCNTPELKKLNRKELDRLTSEAMHYRFSLGVIVMGMFNSIKACGDSWEGCFTAMEQQPNSGTACERKAA